MKWKLKFQPNYYLKEYIIHFKYTYTYKYTYIYSYPYACIYIYISILVGYDTVNNLLEKEEEYPRKYLGALAPIMILTNTSPSSVRKYDPNTHHGVFPLIWSSLNMEVQLKSEAYVSSSSSMNSTR